MSGLKVNNDRLKALGLFDKYKEGTKTNATAGGSGGGGSISGFSTELKQDDIISELQSLVAKPDTEIIESIGIDTNILSSLTITTPTSNSLGTGGGTNPTIANVTSNSFTYEEFNDNYEIIVPITAGIPTTGIVTLYIQFEQNQPNPGNNGGTFTLQDTARLETLATTRSTDFSSSPSVQILQLTFDNTANSYSTLSLILRSFMSTTGYPASYKVTLLGSTPTGFNPTNLITRRDTYEDNVNTATTYLDSSGQPYTLVGTFLRDSNRSTEERLNTLLNSINNKISTESTQELQLITAERTNTFLQNNEAVIVRLSDVASGVLPTFPFIVDTLGIGFVNVFNTYNITSTTVNNMTELVNLWNTNVAEVKLLEVNSTSFKIVPGTFNLSYLPNDFISINNGFTTQRVWRSTRFIPSVRDEANASGIDKLLEQSRRNYLIEQFKNWDFLRSSQKIIAYYPASTPGSDTNNPSGNAGNISTVQYRFGFITHLTQTFAYDTSDNVITITTT